MSTSLHRHLCFFLFILFAFVGFTWYINYESIFEGLFDQIKLILIISPLLLLLSVHLLSTFEKSFAFTQSPEKDSDNGGTPWGVGLVLVLLLFMISYQSDFRERWYHLHS
ncbi:hypothetical protein ACJIZ3_007622 [Penstemon smallii]|uniref:Uncharacterized protein n=1 Tax=Penstemon smallii TaxID=265156 RepID=A0ABD3T8E1_9LAMI